jgi:hypothetical protein
MLRDGGEMTNPEIELTVPPPASAKPDRAVVAAVSRRRAAGVLTAIVVLSIALRVALGSRVPAPFFFLDELGYEQMARSFAQTGHFALYGKGGLAYSPLYPLVISPVYALTSSASTAYEWVKVVNAVLMSLSVVPVYAIARYVLSRRLSLTVAALAAIAPVMAYSSLELSENLAYPLCLVAIWATLRAVRAPGLRNDLVMLGAIVLASGARLQLVVLVPAAVTAILLVALLEPTGDRRRARGVADALRAHGVFLSVLVAGLVAVVARTAANGGELPLAGRYSIVGKARPSVQHVLEVILDHVAGLDLAVGVIPFACALLMAVVLARAGFPRRGLVFGAVALALTAWLLLEVGFDAAAFDRGRTRAASGQFFGDVPRIHERYLIYVVPFFLVALVAAVHRAYRRVDSRIHLLIAGCAALLPAVIPYAADLNVSLVGESPSLQLLASVDRGRIVAVSHATVVAVAVAAALSLVYLLSLMGRHRPLAMVTTVAVLVVASAAYATRIVATGKGSLTLNLSSPGDWVDRTGAQDVALISGKGIRRVAMLETAFFNVSATRLYYVCWRTFEDDFGESQLLVGPDGRLRDAAGPVRARYAVVPARFHLRGRILARDERGRLELVAPAQGFLTVPPSARNRLGCR